jgi:tetratricopeptide (TPR) repeat protein
MDLLGGSRNAMRSQFIPLQSRLRLTSAEPAVCVGSELGTPAGRGGLASEWVRWVMNGQVTASSGVFISYRRADSDYPAGWLFERLAEHFGRDRVFKDVDSLEPGDDFVEVITAALSSCSVLVAVIGKRWLTITDEHGRRRLDDPSDFVRLEIEAALSRDVRIVPVLVDRAGMPRSADLPPGLQPLARRQAIELSPHSFDTSALMRVLDVAMSASPAPVPPVSEGLFRGPALAGPYQGAVREQRSRRTERWTADEVISAVSSSGDDAAAIARAVTGWAAGPHLRLTGGMGPSYPSFTVEADSGRAAGSRWRGVLALYASPHGGPPALEIRVKRICRTPPYNRRDYRDRLIASLHALGIARLDREADLSGMRPEIPLSELTVDRLDRLLTLIDHWITDVRAHAGEPETTTAAALAGAAGTRAVEDGRPDGQHYADGADDWHASRPDRARAADHYGRAVKWYMRGTRKLTEYREAVRLDPGNAGYRYALAGKLRDAGKAAEAEAEYREAARLDPGNADYRYALGLLLDQAKRPPEAEAEFREAVRLDPGNAGYRYALAGRLRDAGKAAEAEAEYREAIRLEPRNRDYRYALGLLQNEAKRPPGGGKLVAAEPVTSDNSPQAMARVLAVRWPSPWAYAFQGWAWLFALTMMALTVGSAFGLESLPWLWVLVPGTLLATGMAINSTDFGFSRRGKAAGAVALFWAVEGALIALVVGYLRPAAAIPIMVIALFAIFGLTKSAIDENGKPL